MRLLKIPFLIVALVLALSGGSFAQVIGPADCDDIAPFNTDTIRVFSRDARPGTIISVPIWIHNQTRGIASFQAYLEFDSTVLKPIVTGQDTLFDSLGGIIRITKFYDWDANGRFLYTETAFDSLGFPFLDTTTNLQVVDEPDFPGTGNFQRVRILGSYEDFQNPETVIPIGLDTVMFIRMTVMPKPQFTLANVRFYDEEILTYDNSIPPVLVRRDCLYSRYTNDSGNVDVRFTDLGGFIRTDSNFNPPALAVINSFQANPPSISAGGTSQLSWNVTGATTVSINNGVGTGLPLVGNANVSPSATTVYTLTATNAAGSVTANATVTVGSVSNNSPVVQNVTGAPFTINQGETVNFSVTATDADAADIITLTATSIPANASFSQQVGNSSVTGSFSFTPDFTQSGAFVASFRATDNRGGISNTLSVIINVLEIENDRLFSTSALGQRPVGGLRGTQAIFFPINLVTAQTVYGVQFDMFYNAIYFTVDSFVTTGRTVDFVVYDNIGGTLGEVRVLTFGLENEAVVNVEDTTAILYAVMSIDSAAPAGDYPIYLDSGWESINPDPDFPAIALVTDSGVIQVDRPGDVNLDSRINVADLVNVVASIINSFVLSQRQFAAADVIVNNIVDVFDLVGIINAIYGLPFSPTPPGLFEDEFATISLAYNDISAGSSDLLVVNSELPVDIAAVELIIDYDPEMITLGKPTLGTDAAQLSIQHRDDAAGKMKVLMHFTNPFNSGQLIQQGNAQLLNVPITARGDVVYGDKNQLKITQALLSTSSAAKVEVLGVDNPDLPATFLLKQNYPNPFNPTTRIEFSIERSENVALNIYNILGQHVRNLIDGKLSAGAHSVEWDATDDHGQRVATGIYLYRLQVQQQTESKKMLLLK